MKAITIIPALLLVATRLYAAPLSLLDGKTFTGWEGDTANTWRIEDCVLAAGSLEKRLVKNEFLSTTKEFTDIEPTLKWKAEGKHVNGGVELCSMRGADSQEVSGCHPDCVAARAPNSVSA